jgi:elongation factor P
MPTIPVNALKKGMTILFNGGPHIIVATEHVKPGKGPAYVQAKMKSIKADRIVENRFSSSDKVEALTIARAKHTYSYEAGDAFIFMDAESFEEYHVPKEMMGERILFLKAGDEVDLEFCNEDLLGVVLPKSVVHEITDTPPALKGATATNQLKPATTETGLIVKVPPFIAIGERIRIDTESGDYVERDKS